MYENSLIKLSALLASHCSCVLAGVVLMEHNYSPSDQSCPTSGRLIPSDGETVDGIDPN